MKERKIAFNGAMVRAILADQKTQTRRVMKNPPTPSAHFPWLGVKSLRGTHSFVYPNALPEILAECPYGQPGDRLWVQEEWGDVNLYGAPAIAYSADGDLMDLMEHESFLTKDGAFDYEAKRIKPYSFDAWAYDLIGGIEGIWRPAKHMPRWASRILLEVVSVRIERLQNISESDAEAEGCAAEPCDHKRQNCEDIGCCGPTAVGAYRYLWDSINGAGSWAANPWVWVVEFKRVEEQPL